MKFKLDQQTKRKAFKWTSSEGGYVISMGPWETGGWLIRVIQVASLISYWIRPQFHARTETVSMLTVNVLQILLSGLPDAKFHEVGETGERDDPVYDVLHTFSCVCCNGDDTNAHVDEKKLRKYIKALKGGHGSS